MSGLPEDLDPVEVSLLTGIRSLSLLPGIAPAHDVPDGFAAVLFEAQVASRLVDHTARYLRTKGLGYYSISSAGHESDAAVALALRPSDPSLSHYRSGGFYMARAAQVLARAAQLSAEMPGLDPVDDVLRGILASVHEPITGGRHKVLGRKELNIVPLTSTIGSHLPRAVGLALSLGMEHSSPNFEPDSIVVAGIGDASLNHSTVQGAMNWAANMAHRGRRVPVLFLVEDNGLGISVPTPQDWVAQSASARWGLDYATADGADPSSVFTTASALADQIRATGRPAILHLRTVRFLGHAGTDVEAAYRSAADIRADQERDPILGTATLLVQGGECEAEELVQWYLEERLAVRARALELAGEQRLHSAAEVMAAISPRRPATVADLAKGLVGSGEARAATRPEPEQPESRTLAQAINAALAAAMTVSSEILVFGEDVARKGGVYGVTRGLQKRFGAERVFDTILDEQAILGRALGAGLNGFIPVPEIQYLAYLHNAEDQLRGEAATMSFFSNRQYQNPMVVRIASFAYQKGFGGHYHNDNSVAVLRDIPGLLIAVPAHPSDAGALLRTCLASAQADGTVSAFLEPIARYHTADLHEDGDGLWLTGGLAARSDDAGSEEHIPVGRARTYGSGLDLTILTWGNGLFMSLRVQKKLREQEGINARVVDLRWLAPLPTEDMLREANITGRVLIVDETRRSGGVGEAIIAELVEQGFNGKIKRVAGADSLIPLGEAADLVLVSEDQIAAAARSCLA